MDRPRIFGLCVVKDEDDIIAETLTYALRHCDRIFVLDNGSTDRTWEIVQDLTQTHSAIVPFDRVLSPFDGRLRARVYNAIHSQLSADDWWLVLDADEFLAEDPRAFIGEAARAGADIIYTWQIQFYFTERDLQSWERGEDARHTSIFDRRQHYLIDWQECRLFRNNPSRAWNETAHGALPGWLTKIHKARILNRHYQYRDPEQMTQRLRLRDGHPHFTHVRSTDWRTLVRDSRTLQRRIEGEPWHFSPGTLFHFYRRSLYMRARRRIDYMARGLRSAR